MEGEKKELQEKTESLESIVRMIELKAKNSADHGKIYILYKSLESIVRMIELKAKNSADHGIHILYIMYLYVCFVIKIRYLKEKKYDLEYASNFTETCKM